MCLNIPGCAFQPRLGGHWKLLLMLPARALLRSVKTTIKRANIRLRQSFLPWRVLFLTSRYKEVLLCVVDQVIDLD